MSYLIGAGLIILYLIAANQIGFSLLNFMQTVPDFINFLSANFFPPNIMALGKYVPAILGTISVAILASVIGVILAFLLSLLISDKTAPSKVLATILRIILAMFRNIPMLIWATLFVIVVGVGSSAGIVALVLFTTTFLTRIFSDSLDGLDPGPIEAMRAVGASKIVRIRYGLLSSFTPQFITWLLFMIEINIKASSILGLVGAGGLGYELKKNMDLFRYKEASALVIVIVVMLLIIEFVSNKIRKIIL